MITLFCWKYGQCQGLRASLLPNVSSSIQLTHKPDRIIPLKTKENIIQDLLVTYLTTLEVLGLADVILN